MSEAYAEEARLVEAGSNSFVRALDAAIALAIITFLLGLLTLVRAVPLATSGAGTRSIIQSLLAVGVGGIGLVGLTSALGVVPVTADRVRGIGFGLLVVLLGLAGLTGVLSLSVASLLGCALLLQAAVVLVAGVASRQHLVETTPSATPGLLAGAAFGLVGLLVGAAIGGTALGGTPTAYYGSGLVGAVALFGLTVGPREDLGSALPVAFLVGVLGAAVVSGAIGPGWAWAPGPDIDGSFTGGVVVPLFALLGSIVAGWGAAKARAGYGARGRQYGAFLVVHLNAGLMVAIMLAIVAFVLAKGLAYAAHGVTVGALTGFVLLAPALVFALNYARSRAGTEEWHDGVRQAVRVLPLAAVGSLAAGLLLVQLRGRSLSLPFSYTVQENREQVPLDTAATVVTEPTVGALVLLLVGSFLTWYFLRRYDTIRGIGPQDARLATLERGVGTALGIAVLLVFLLVVPLPRPLGVPLDALGTVAGAVGGPAVPAMALAGLGLSLAAPAGLILGTGDLVDRGMHSAQLLRVGLFGGVALLVAAAVLESVTGVNPGVGPNDLVPVVALVAALSALCVAAAAAGSRTAGARERTVSRREAALGLGAASGFLVVLGLHVAVTGQSVSVGPVTVDTVGTLSWPMTMSGYIPLTPDPGGIMPAVVGTAWLVVGAAAFAVPLGVGAAVFLTEYAEQGRLTALVEVATNALWSTPSIVFGLFGAAFLIPRFGGDESLLSGMLVLGFMLLPLVMITSREAIKSVPEEYRDASAALGVSKWKTVRSVVLPAAVPGVITGVILGIGRIAGETAPLILVLGSTLNATEAIDVLGGFQIASQPPFVSNPALLEASAALPTQVWAVISAGVSGSPSMGWASALILLLVVLTFYAVGIVARTHFRRKLDHE